MKKLMCVCAAMAFFSAVSAKPSGIIGFDVGLASGLPVYSGDFVSDMNDRVNDGNFNRAVAGGIFDISFRLGKPLKVVAGADLLCDFIWSGKNYSNHLDYAFWGGLKVYPGAGGLNCSVAYAFGRRTDFRNNAVEDSVVSSTAWGNGFRLGIEYDFLYTSSRSWLPALGVYYRFMPRGDDMYDNIFAVYVSIVH